jgi:hypothetical protein
MSNTRETLEWKEPPPPQSRGGFRPWVRRLSPLVDRPEQWAKVMSAGLENRGTLSSYVSHLTHGRYVLPDIPAGHRFEVTVRTEGDTVNLYVRLTRHPPKKDER